MLDSKKVAGAVVVSVGALLAVLLVVGQRTVPPAARATHAEQRASTAADALVVVRGSVSGTVVGADARPRPGVDVALIQLQAVDVERPKLLASRVTGPDGAFSFRELAPGRYLVSAASAAIGTSLSEEIDITASENITLELALRPGENHLAGEVLDIDGGAIPGAVLRFAPRGDESGNAMFLSRSDDSGRFAIALAPARYAVVATADGYAAQTREIDVRSMARVRFRLRPASHVFGQVLTTGELPVAEAEVSLIAVRDTRSTKRATTTTSESGRFSFDSVAPGIYVLTAREGHSSGRTPQPFEVGPGEGREVIVELTAAATWSGRVESDRGDAIAGATISVRSIPDGQLTSSEQTHADGTFVFQGLLAAHYEVTVDAPGFIAERGDLLVAANEPVSPGMYTLRSGATIAGVVKLADGTVVGDALVTLRVGQTTDDRWHRTRSRTDGTFSFEGLQREDGTLSASHPNHGVSGLVSVALSSGRNGSGVELTLASGAELGGTVTWDDGSPAAEVSVTAAFSAQLEARLHTKTEADGSFVLHGVPPGEAYVRASATGARSFFGDTTRRADRATLTVSANERKGDVVLVLQRQDGAVRGTVSDALGTPIDGVHVRAFASDEVLLAPSAELASAFTLPDGSFELAGLPRGTVTITAGRLGHSLARAEAVPVGSYDVDLRLSTGATISGRATAGTDPADGFTLMLIPSGDAPRAEVALRTRVVYVYDSMGEFTEDGLPPGAYDILASAADGLAGRLDDVVVRDGEHRRDLTIPLTKGAVLSGKVRDASTQTPIAGASVALHLPWRLLTTTTDALGSFAIDGVPPGSWPIIVSAAGYDEHFSVSRIESDASLDVVELNPIVEVAPPGVGD